MTDRDATDGMEVLVIEPGHGSVWVQNAVYVDRFGKPTSRGRFVTGNVWAYDGGWNMPDDYQGQWESYTTRRRLILKVARPPMTDRDATDGTTPQEVEVELWSTEEAAVRMTRQAIEGLGGVLFERDGRWFIGTFNPGFIQFAVVQQGYVRSVPDD